MLVCILIQCMHTVNVSHYEFVLHFNIKPHFFTTISRLASDNGSVVFGKCFNIEFWPDLYILGSPKSEKGVFENWSDCVCMSATVWGIFSAFYSTD